MLRVEYSTTNPIPMEIKYRTNSDDCAEVQAFLDKMKKLAQDLSLSAFRLRVNPGYSVMMEHEDGSLIEMIDNTEAYDYCREVAVSLTSGYPIENARRLLKEAGLNSDAPLQLKAVELSRKIPNTLLYEYFKVYGMQGVSRAELSGGKGSEWYFNVKLDYTPKKKSVDILGVGIPKKLIEDLSRLYVRGDIDFYNPWNEMFRWAWALRELLKEIPQAEKVDVTFELDHANRHYSGVGTVALRNKEGDLLVEYSFERGALSSTYPNKYLETFEKWMNAIRKKMGPRFYEYALVLPRG